MVPFDKRKQRPVLLEDDATIVVVGGGPAGSFFAIRMLRKARELGKKIDLVIIERKKELQFYHSSFATAPREGCAYCAGGISPKLSDALADAGLTLPAQIMQGRIDSLTLHGDWKNIELRVPEGRRMTSVFRGAGLKHWPDRHMNFDAFVLEKAVEEGARVITGEVLSLHYSQDTKPVVTYRLTGRSEQTVDSIDAEFVVFAGGVNRTPGMTLEDDRNCRSLGRYLPGFRPPKVRKALIFELAVKDEHIRYMEGEVHFVLYGSRSLKIDMSSLIPKTRCITVVLLGRSIDTAGTPENLSIVQEFMELPHIRTLLPRNAILKPICICNPNMTVGAARNAYAHRVALTGDAVVSRLYKDGILSAYQTSSALADCILDVGVDRASLKTSYWPLIRRFRRDCWFGRHVFFLNRIAFSNPVLSRILYQAVLTERKTKPKHKRRLNHLLWNIASGDDTYENIFFSMFHPATLAQIATGGFLITIRNYLTERVFGLKWKGLQGYTTGVLKEVFEARRLEFIKVLGSGESIAPEQFESMYSIKIKAPRERIFHQLGKFGDSDREYFTPRMIRVHRTAGRPNHVGSIIKYDLPHRWFGFSIVLEKVVDGEYLVYRVQDGFARGGVLVFAVSPVREDVFLLSIYIRFSFLKPKGWIRKLGWHVFRALFPGFMHDVVWNHSLCQLKHVAELDEEISPVLSSAVPRGGERPRCDPRQ